MNTIQKIGAGTAALIGRLDEIFAENQETEAVYAQAAYDAEEADFEAVIAAHDDAEVVDRSAFETSLAGASATIASKLAYVTNNIDPAAKDSFQEIKDFQSSNAAALGADFTTWVASVDAQIDDMISTIGVPSELEAAIEAQIPGFTASW